MQAVLYLSEARSAQRQRTLEDIPQTLRRLPSLQQHWNVTQLLYRASFDKACEISRIAADLQGSEILPEELDAIIEKRVVLNPLQFEAMLQLANSEAAVDELSLFALVQEAQDLGAPAESYALFADMILSSTLPVQGEDEANSPPRLSTTIAISLLRKVINSVRHLENYDFSQASRWIRCVAELILDTTKVLSIDPEERGRLLKEITSQAVILSRASRDSDIRVQGDVQMQEVDQDTDESLQTPPTAYPAEELEWLATKLFNWAIDLYLAGSEDQAKEWANRAVEIADTLALGPDGDRGALAEVMRERMGRFAWL